MWGDQPDCGIALFMETAGAARCTNPLDFFLPTFQLQGHQGHSFPRTDLRCTAWQWPCSPAGAQLLGRRMLSFSCLLGDKISTNCHGIVCQRFLSPCLCFPPLSQVIDNQGTRALPLCQARVEEAHAIYHAATQQTTACIGGYSGNAPCLDTHETASTARVF